MAKFLFRTIGNAPAKGKPRVYFTCHPEDFERSFEMICENIFATHDCAIYYTEDMTERISDEDKATDLEQMNLFVIPVSYRLLTTPNRAMDSDFSYAKGKHIPTLPIMLESGIDSFYSMPDKFGELQYLNPYSHDLTEISYSEKLKKYLDSVLISDEMAKRVREAFDAYIFLSYRKKDRLYANELMKLIHKNPECRDVAIWYDEFLTPGESFQENIDKILSNSRLFALLVTPNLLEDANFVMREEYPAAKKAGLDILPAEMEETDKNELKAKYKNIPDCVNPNNDEEFKNRLLTTIKKVAMTANDNDPEHNFLIGLAYLEGIDVETDREKGVALVRSAAEQELPEAIKKLCDMYMKGANVKLNYNEALVWAKKLVDIYAETLGDEDPKTLNAYNTLALAYDGLNEYQKLLETCERLAEIDRRIYGEDDERTLSSLGDLAYAYSKVEEYQKAIELNERVYETECRILGEDHPQSITTLNNLACDYIHREDFQRACDLLEEALNASLRVNGENNIDTINAMSNLARAYGKLDNHGKGIELVKKSYEISRRVLGEDHPSTLSCLSNIAYQYTLMNEYGKAHALYQEAHEAFCRVLGEGHPQTSEIAWMVFVCSTLSNLTF